MPARSIVACVAAVALLAAGGVAEPKQCSSAARTARTWPRSSAGWASAPDGIFGPGTKRAVKRFQRQSRPHGGRDRRPGDVARAALRAHAPRLELRRRARRAPWSTSSARSASPPTASSAPAPRRAVKALPAQPRPDRRRDRRPGDLERARPRRPHDHPQAPRRTAAAAAATATVARVDRGRQPDRDQAVQVRRRPRAAGTTAATTARARSRTPCTAADCSRARSTAAVHELGRAGPGPAHHDLREPRPRVHGHQRPSLRHDRPQRDRHALAAASSAHRRATRSATRRASKPRRAPAAVAAPISATVLTHPRL